MRNKPLTGVFEALVITAFLTMGLLLITRPQAFGALNPTLAIIIGILFVLRGAYRLFMLIRKMRQPKDEA